MMTMLMTIMTIIGGDVCVFGRTFVFFESESCRSESDNYFDDNIPYRMTV